MATERSQVYKCAICNSMVETTNSASGTLSCCQQEMSCLKENTTDAAQEKHVPLAKEVNGGIEVVVGSVAHPMEEKHLIEWIEVIADGKVYREYLTAGNEPKAFFPVSAKSFVVREFCNLHGLWKA